VCAERGGRKKKKKKRKRKEDAESGSFGLNLGAKSERGTVSLVWRHGRIYVYSFKPLVHCATYELESNETKQKKYLVHKKEKYSLSEEEKKAKKKEEKKEIRKKKDAGSTREGTFDGNLLRESLFLCPSINSLTAHHQKEQGVSC
jgi:hypothetical protein